MSERGVTSQKGYLDLPDGQIHYLTAVPYARPPDQPPLVLIHSGTKSSRMWEGVMSALANGGRWVIAFDTPGYGMSDRPPSRPDLAYYTRQFVEAADALNLAVFDLLGLHVGSLLAGAVAVARPDRVRKLVLSGYHLMDPARRARMATPEARPFSPDGHELLKLWEDLRTAYGSSFTPEIGVRSMIEVLQAGPTWKWAPQAIAGDQRYDEQLPARIAVPTLSLCGDQDGILGDVREAAKLIPNSKTFVFEGAGIFVHDEAPELFVRVVDEFLKEPVAAVGRA